MATNLVKYVVKNAVRNDQPSASNPNPKGTDGILKLSGNVTKDGKVLRTGHIIIKHRQMPEYVATKSVNGTTISFALTESKAGRGKSKPTPAAEADALEARYAAPAENVTPPLAHGPRRDGMPVIATE